MREQVRYLASDQPSAVLHRRLESACPGLRGIYLDEVHLVIVYHEAFWRKSSPGQAALRRVQAKFNRIDPAKAAEHWGPLYTGQEDVSYKQVENGMRDTLLKKSMSTARACHVLNNLDDESPWYSKLDYITALAAIASAFPSEMARKTYVGGKTVGHILWNASAPEKVAWQFNAIIVRHEIPKCMVKLLGSGTATNESLHAELNRWYRSQPEVFPTTLELQLDVARLGKMLAHNAAMYHPTSRQVRHEQVRDLAVSGCGWNESEWQGWCAQCRRDDAIIPAPLPKAAQRKELGEKIAAKGKPQAGRRTVKYVVKKPAGRGSPANKNTVVIVAEQRELKRPWRLKRTPFTLDRAL